VLRIGRLGFGILVEVRLVTRPASFQVHSCPWGEGNLMRAYETHLTHETAMFLTWIKP